MWGQLCPAATLTKPSRTPRPRHSCPPCAPLKAMIPRGGCALHCLCSVRLQVSAGKRGMIERSWSHGVHLSCRPPAVQSTLMLLLLPSFYTNYKKKYCFWPKTTKKKGERSNANMDEHVFNQVSCEIKRWATILNELWALKKKSFCQFSAVLNHNKQPSMVKHEKRCRFKQICWLKKGRADTADRFHWSAWSLGVSWGTV